MAIIVVVTKANQLWWLQWILRKQISCGGYKREQTMAVMANATKANTLWWRQRIMVSITGTIEAADYGGYRGIETDEGEYKRRKRQ